MCVVSGGAICICGHAFEARHLGQTERRQKGCRPVQELRRLLPRCTTAFWSRVEEGESIRGGIIIPDSAKEKPQQGEVISVGKGKSNDEGKVFPLDVKAGDSILFGKYSGTEIKLDGEEFLIMREEEVLGILKK
jgi:chaperonin GroES